MKHAIIALALGLASTTAFADSYYKYEDVESKPFTSSNEIELTVAAGMSEAKFMDTDLESIDLELSGRVTMENNLVLEAKAHGKSAEYKNTDVGDLTMLAASAGYKFDIDGGLMLTPYVGAFDLELDPVVGSSLSDDGIFFGARVELPLNRDLTLVAYGEKYDFDMTGLDEERYGADLQLDVSENVDVFAGIESFGEIDTVRAGLTYKF